jgi:hypothetical protein
VPPSLIITESDGLREDHDIFSTTTDFERTASGAFATVRRDERASVDEGDLLIVMLFVAIGLLLNSDILHRFLRRVWTDLVRGRLIVAMRGQGPVSIGQVPSQTPPTVFGQVDEA